MRLVALLLGLFIIFVGFSMVLYVGNESAFFGMLAFFEGFGRWLGANFFILLGAAVLITLGAALAALAFGD